jgi:O-antigen/teichoic acid export membrane protein
MASPSPAASLRLRTARAAVTSGGAEIVGRFLSIFLSIATARALLPREVGVLGLAAIVVGFISMTASYMETAAVVSHAEGSDEEFSLVALLGRAALTVLLLVILVGGMPRLSRWLVGGGESAQSVRALVALLAWQPLIEVLGAYPRVLLQRRLDLTYLAFVTLVQVVCHVSLAVLLLWRGLGAVAVVYGALAGVAFGALLPWLRLFGTAPRSWLITSPGVLRAFGADFSRVFANGFFTYVNAQVDKVLVSSVLGPAAMSFYGIAWSASRFPAGVLAQSLRFSVMPAVARLQNDRSSVERALVESLRYSMLLAAPLAAVLFVCARSLVTVVLGERWLPVVPALQIMSVAVLTAPVLEASVTLIIGMGRAHLTAIASSVTIVVLVVSTPLLAARWGVVGAAYGNLISALVLMFTSAMIARMTFAGIRWLRPAVVLTPILAAGVSAIAAFTLAGYRGAGIEQLSIEIAIIAILYPLTLCLSGGRDALVDLVVLVRRALPTGATSRSFG